MLMHIDFINVHVTIRSSKERKVIIRMRQKIKKHLTLIVSLFIVALPIAIPLGGYGIAEATTCSNSIQSQLGSGLSAAGVNNTCSSTTTIQSGIKNAAKIVVNILSIVVGIVAVIMLIFGGFRYITSGGESNSVSSAKNTLLYAIVGLVIVFLAQVIVHWVLNTTSQIVGFLH